MTAESQLRRSVVFVHGSLGMGGAEVLRLSVLEELALRGDLQIRVCVLRDRGVLSDRVEALGIPLDVLGNRGGLLDLFGILRLARYLRKHRPDVAQGSQFLTNLQTRLAGWIARTPAVIIEEHGMYSWKRWYHRLIDRWINRHASAIVACSTCVADFAAKIFHIKVSEITVIHNCVEEGHFDSSPVDVDSIRRENGGESSFVVGIVGTLRWEKGHEYLLGAWKSLRKENKIPSDSRLWIIGTGPLEKRLCELASGTEGVVFLGQRAGTRELLRSMDLFVLPSVNEGFGIAIIEAMCAGTPVISTDSGGIPEVINSGKTGILVPPYDSGALADAIERLYGDKSLRQSLADAAKADASNRFSPKRYVDDLIRLYAQFGQAR